MLATDEVQMNRWRSGWLLLALALALSSAGCANAAKSTAAAPTSIAAAMGQPTRPTVTPGHSPAVGPTVAPATGGLTVAMPASGDRTPTVRVDRLPPQAHETMRLIARNGPFPYRQDGATFENRERLLPAKPSGYYREYTVETPGSPDRGGRRLVRGGQGELYYTDDHYDSFRRVTP
jgi:guanyl-specific ribonuclease Sa